MDLGVFEKIHYKGYWAVVVYDPEDGLLVGHVTGVDDVLGFHGNTKEEAVVRFHLCIDDYIDICKRYGRTADKST